MAYCKKRGSHMCTEFYCHFAGVCRIQEYKLQIQTANIIISIKTPWLHSVAKLKVLTVIWLHSALLIFRAYQFWIFKIEIPKFSIKKRRYYVVCTIKKATLCTQGFFCKD